MDALQIVFTSVAGLLATWIGYLKFRDAGKLEQAQRRISENDRRIAELDRSVLVLQAEVAECHRERQSNEASFAELRRLIEDKNQRIEFERDQAMAHLHAAQNRIIELQDRLQVKRRP